MFLKVSCPRLEHWGRLKVIKKTLLYKYNFVSITKYYVVYIPIKYW